MNHSFSIDLVVCTYNNASLLQRTLQSLENLEVPGEIKWSVLVVDNNCTDNTAAVVEQFARRGVLRISIIVEKEQGLTPARVCGVKHTTAAWIAFIDDDCLLMPGWIEQAAFFLGTHPACKLFGSRIKLLWEQEPPAYVAYFPFAFAGKNHGDHPHPVKSVAGAGMVVNRKALENCGWIDEQLLEDRTGKKLVSGGDVEICLRVGSMYEVWYNPACTLQHIITQQRVTRKYLQRIIFGLGISRHHTAALKWHRSYFLWLVFASFYSCGMLMMGVNDALFSRRRAAGWGIAFSSYFGWCAGMTAMLRMSAKRRNKILGAAVHQNTPTLLDPANT